MKIRLLCPDCSGTRGGVGEFFLETIQESGLYQGHCPNGHKLCVGTQTLPHEMLFEIAMNAIIDGYMREAISSFAASVERYFEFAVQALTLNRPVSPGLFKTAWAQVDRQSERQLGAYIFLFLISFGEMPRLLNPPMVKMRNDVIHRGHLPDREEALAFGREAHTVIQEGISKLRRDYLNDVERTLGLHVERIAAQMGSEYPRTFQITTTALNIIHDTSKGYAPFDDLMRQRGIE